MHPNAQFSVLGDAPTATGKCIPTPLVAPAACSMISSGVNTNSQPLVTLNASAQMTVFAPAPSAEALIPDVPAAPAVPPVMTEAASATASLVGVALTKVGNAVTCVLICTR